MKIGLPDRLLVINAAEAVIVRRIYALYQFGLNGHPVGVKPIADYFNQQGITMRGATWRNQKINQILSNPVYIGEHYFNRTHCKQQTKKPPAEWIKSAVPAIIDRAAFETVRELRSARAPSTTPPRVVTNPTLLTGLLKCGCCGTGMTLTTGKSGRYQYYKCTTKHSKATFLCATPNLPMHKLDDLVLNRLAERVFTAERVQHMLQDLQTHLQQSKTDEDRQLEALKRELQQVEDGQKRLYQAVEQGFLPLDNSLSSRAHQLKAQRENLLTAMAGLRRQ